MKFGSIALMSSSIRSGPQADIILSDQTTIRLQGIVWKKRKPGLGKLLSDKIGASGNRTWDRRRLVLYEYDEYGDKTSKYYKLSYYDETYTTKLKLQNLEVRGTLDLLPDRASIICTTHPTLTEPTPYSLAVKTTDGTKWKLCFDDRTSQLTWLSELTEALIDSSAHTQAVEDKSQWGPSYPTKESLLDTTNTLLLESVDANNSSRPSEFASASPRSVAAAPVATSKTILNPLYDGPGYFVPANRFYYSMTIINIAFLYLHMTETTTLNLLVVLLAANAMLYICLSPLSTTTTTTTNAKPKKKENDLLSLKDEGMETQPVSVPAKKEVLNKDGTKQEKKTFQQIQTQQRVELIKDEGSNNNTTGDANIHHRWAVSAPDVDLSGSWTLISDDEFKKQNDKYLKDIGFNIVIRQLACTLISRTYETTKQTEGGRKLYLISNNPKGSWERLLISSGYPDFDTSRTDSSSSGEEHSKCNNNKHERVSIKTADSEDVIAEAWWENQGTVHRSWLRGSEKYGGGDHESRRYLEDGGKILVCESIFHRQNNYKSAAVRWRFKRDE